MSTFSQGERPLPFAAEIGILTDTHFDAGQRALWHVANLHRVFETKNCSFGTGIKLLYAIPEADHLGTFSLDESEQVSPMRRNPSRSLLRIGSKTVINFLLRKTSVVISLDLSPSMFVVDVHLTAGPGSLIIDSVPIALSSILNALLQSCDAVGSFDIEITLITQGIPGEMVPTILLANRVLTISSAPEILTACKDGIERLRHKISLSRKFPAPHTFCPKIPCANEYCRSNDVSELLEQCVDAFGDTMNFFSDESGSQKWRAIIMITDGILNPPQDLSYENNIQTRLYQSDIPVAVVQVGSGDSGIGLLADDDIMRSYSTISLHERLLRNIIQKPRKPGNFFQRTLFFRSSGLTKRRVPKFKTPAQVPPVLPSPMVLKGIPLPPSSPLRSPKYRPMSDIGSGSDSESNFHAAHSASTKHARPFLYKAYRLPVGVLASLLRVRLREGFAVEAFLSTPPGPEAPTGEWFVKLSISWGLVAEIVYEVTCFGGEDELRVKIHIKFPSFHFFLKFKQALGAAPVGLPDHYLRTCQQLDSYIEGVFMVDDFLAKITMHECTRNFLGCMPSLHSCVDSAKWGRWFTVRPAVLLLRGPRGSIHTAHEILFSALHAWEGSSKDGRMRFGRICGAQKFPSHGDLLQNLFDDYPETERVLVGKTLTSASPGFMLLEIGSSATDALVNLTLAFHGLEPKDELNATAECWKFLRAKISSDTSGSVELVPLNLSPALIARLQSRSEEEGPWAAGEVAVASGSSDVLTNFHEMRSQEGWIPLGETAGSCAYLLEAANSISAPGILSAFLTEGVKSWTMESDPQEKIELKFPSPPVSLEFLPDNYVQELPDYEALESTSDEESNEGYAKNPEYFYIAPLAQTNTISPNPASRKISGICMCHVFFEVQYLPNRGVLRFHVSATASIDSERLASLGSRLLTETLSRSEIFSELQLEEPVDRTIMMLTSCELPPVFVGSSKFHTWNFSAPVGIIISLVFEISIVSVSSHRNSEILVAVESGNLIISKGLLVQIGRTKRCFSVPGFQSSGQVVVRVQNCGRSDGVIVTDLRLAVMQ